MELAHIIVIYPKKKTSIYISCSIFLLFMVCVRARGHLKNAYELLNLRALKYSLVNKRHIFQCMGKIFCVEFQRVPLKFHTKYLAHTLKETLLCNVQILRALGFKSSFFKRPPCPSRNYIDIVCTVVHTKRIILKRDSTLISHL